MYRVFVLVLINTIFRIGAQTILPDEDDTGQLYNTILYLLPLIFRYDDIFNLKFVHLQF